MHSYVSCLMHCVWATKERQPLIKPDLQQRLWPYPGGIARKNKMKALVVGAWKTTFTYSSHYPLRSPWRNPSNCSKAILRSGFMTLSRNMGISRCRKDTAHSVLEFPASTTRPNTFKDMRSTRGRCRSRKNSKRFSRNTEWNLWNKIWNDFYCPCAAWIGCRAMSQLSYRFTT